MTRFLTAAALVAMFLSAPHHAAAQGSAMSPRLALHGAFGFAGQGDIDINSNTGVDLIDAIAMGNLEGALDASLGFGARFESPVLDFLSIGFMGEAIAIEAAEGNDGREWLASFDVWIKLRYSFAVDGVVDVEPYIGVPFGLGLFFDQVGDEIHDRAGWNSGVLAGVQIVLGGSFGFLFEIGWRTHQVYGSWVLPAPFGNVDASLTFNQLGLNAGIVLAF